MNVPASEQFNRVHFSRDCYVTIRLANQWVAVRRLPLAMAAPTALATLKNGGRMISLTPASSSGAMMLPPPTSSTVMSSGEVFILSNSEPPERRRGTERSHLSIIPSSSLLILCIPKVTVSTATSDTFSFSPSSARPLATTKSVAVSTFPPKTFASRVRL